MIEEIFLSLQNSGIALKVFESILIDEHRHVCEAELYQVLGLPDQKMIRNKLAKLEDLMLTNVFLQYKYMFSLCGLLGEQAFQKMFSNLRIKHNAQLGKLNLRPGIRWDSFTLLIEKILSKQAKFSPYTQRVAPTLTRKTFMTQWGEPGDPTMVAHFDLDVSCLHLFNKIYPPETLTILMLQAASKTLAAKESFRHFLHYKKLYRCEEARVSLVVQLPGCDNHIGTIEFENCHLLSAKDLAFKIKQYVHTMSYCYKKRCKIEKEHPGLAKDDDSFFEDFAFGVYDYPMEGTPGISMSNINSSGFTQGTSPLRKTEALKMTLFQVSKKPVWNDEKGEFEAKDLLPISMSADHRIFDGNLPIPKYLKQSFQEIFHKLQKDASQDLPRNQIRDRDLIRMINEYVKIDIELGYQILVLLQSHFFDYFKPSHFERHFMDKVSKILRESL